MGKSRRRKRLGYICLGMLVMQASYMPGADIKGELKNMLNAIYDAGEKKVEETKKMREYTKQALDRILKNTTNEELRSVLCME